MMIGVSKHNNKDENIVVENKLYILCIKREASLILVFLNLLFLPQ